MDACLVKTQKILKLIEYLNRDYTFTSFGYTIVNDIIRVDDSEYKNYKIPGDGHKLQIYVNTGNCNILFWFEHHHNGDIYDRGSMSLDDEEANQTLDQVIRNLGRIVLDKARVEVLDELAKAKLLASGIDV